jgi:hypothetical protein
LIPTDVETADDASLWTNSFELRDVINKLRNQSPEATHYVVFDACREELRLTLAGKKAFSPGEGFVPVPTVAGVMVAYATALSAGARERPRSEMSGTYRPRRLSSQTAKALIARTMIMTLKVGSRITS